MIFQHPIKVNAAHLDAMNHVNNVVYVQWVQDAAAAHWNNYASDEVKRKYSWVVMRHEVDYKSPALLDDELIAKTWVESYDGARSIRIVQLLRKKDDKLLAEAKTTWCLLNSETLRPVRVGDDIKEVFTPSKS